MLDRLQGLPRVDSLRRYVEGLLKEKGDRVVSIVLFGSMARGDYTIHSDYDLLVIVDGEQLNFKDRLLEYSKHSDGWVEPLTYTVDEVRQMLEDLNPLILDALKEGLAIYDRGLWSTLKHRFEQLLKQGVIAPKERGWIIKRPAT